jgi:Immunity protein 8
MTKIRAEVKRLHSPDVYDLSTFVPEDSERFGILVQMMAGPVGEPGEESFDVVVCTPRWLQGELGPNDVKMGRHYLLIKQYDYCGLVRFLQDFAATCSGATWEEVAMRLGRLGMWEFEDYDDHREIGK